MNYTLNQLKIYLKVIEERSITKAAIELHLTQPAVSIQLKNFQAQFDIPLIEVINKKIYITDFGKEIAFSADKILSEVYAINFKMHAYKGQLTGKIKMSVVSSGKYIAPYFVADFMKSHPGVELIMNVTNKQQVLASLEKNEVDFALVSVLPDYLKLNNIELMQNKLFLVGSEEIGNSKKKHTSKLLETIPMIFREQGSGTRHMIEKFILRHDLSVVKTMELTSNEAVKQALIAGLGYSIMPLIGLKNELENGQLKIVPVIDLPIRSVWHMAWLSKKNLSPLASAYLNYIKKEKQAIIHDKFDWFEPY